MCGRRDGIQVGGDRWTSHSSSDLHGNEEIHTKWEGRRHHQWINDAAAADGDVHAKSEMASFYCNFYTNSVIAVIKRVFNRTPTGTMLRTSVSSHLLF